MLSRSAMFGSALVLLAACATQGESPAQAVRPTQPAAETATVLTLRAVPSGTRRSVRSLLAVADDPAAQARPRLLEVIVRTQTGTILSVVQPETPGLKPGDHVNILRATPTRIAAG
jgi:hypothetical protein